MYFFVSTADKNVLSVCQRSVSSSLASIVCFAYIERMRICNPMCRPQMRHRPREKLPRLEFDV